MQKKTIEVEVFVLEESDLEGLNDRARATGKLDGLRRDLEERIQAETGRHSLSVQVSFRSGRGGAVPFLNIGGIKLNAGEAIAFLPTGPAKVDLPAEQPKPVKKAAKKRSAEVAKKDHSKPSEEQGDA